MTTKSETFEILEQNIESIFNDIANNVSFKKISEKYKVNVRYFHEFIHQDKYEQTTRACLRVASHEQVDKARDHLESIEANDTNASVRKKSELSQFELYLAKVKNREDFGDKQQVEQKTTLTVNQDDFVLKQIKNNDQIN